MPGMGRMEPAEGASLLPDSADCMEAAGGNGKEPYVSTLIEIYTDESTENSGQDLTDAPGQVEGVGSAALHQSLGPGPAGGKKEDSHRTPATHLLAKNDANWTTYTSRQRLNKKRRWNSANLAGGVQQGAAAGGAPNVEVDPQDEDPETSEKEENPAWEGGIAAQREERDPPPRVQGLGHP